ASRVVPPDEAGAERIRPRAHHRRPPRSAPPSPWSTALTTAFSAGKFAVKPLTRGPALPRLPRVLPPYATKGGEANEAGSDLLLVVRGARARGLRRTRAAP